MKKRLALFTSVLAGIAGLGYYFSQKVIRNTYTQDDDEEQRLQYKNLVDDHQGKKIELVSDYGYKLIGHAFCQDSQEKKFMVVVHGVTCSKEYGHGYIALFLKMGYNVIAMDSRYHGESGGHDISYGYYERYDLQKIMAYIKDTYGNDSHIGIHGVSMGAGIALMYAGSIEDGADFYIVDCPYSDFYEEARYRVQYDFKHVPSFARKFIVGIGDMAIRLRSGFSLKDVRPIDHVHKITSPILFINTKEDMYIPPEMSQELYDKKRDSKHMYWVEKGGHAMAYTEDPEMYQQEIERFITKYVEKNNKKQE
ncbi:alpha/beta hydrolase [Vallitalea pronyensis]|uniref:Alpha/beta hydrolase n=1 Tax=Vallitalea pronyensis TaxID=1348613 RepID=A0A8J8MLW8_9FIRM|nr:alpha/beta hydrolase [Vallitalea pronyensis]QUI23884.1 alpha/beta hydrolase [Vallitalea pronyensis]